MSGRAGSYSSGKYKIDGTLMVLIISFLSSSKIDRTEFDVPKSIP